MDRPELLAELAEAIAAVECGHATRVALDGVDAAGKTTLADELEAPLEALGRRVIRGSIDRFHNPSAIRHRRGSESPEGYYRDSFDYDALVRSLLLPLGPGGAGEYRNEIFDYRIDAPVESPLQRAEKGSVLLFDGVFLLRPELRRYWDFSIFVEAGFSVTIARAEQRDVQLFGSAAGVRRRYQERYVPGQRLYLAECSPRRHASLVVDNNDPSRPVLSWARDGLGNQEPR